MTPDTTVVSFRALTKDFGAVTAVRDVTFDVHAGRVVGLLGRNGAGKTTLLRTLLGLIHPTSGAALLWGRPYADTPDAARRVGVMLDGMAAIPGATGRRELTIWARALGLPKGRVDEVLDVVELTDAADREARTYSTGMRQRLGLATALLGDPELLVLDEPTNGLDPEGVRWLRRLVRGLADSGRTVLLSSHLLSEVERTVDEVVVLEQDLRFAGPLDAFTAGSDLEERFFELVPPREAVPRHG